MFVGILFTVIVSSAIGAFSFLVFWNGYHANPRFATKSRTAFALFWLGMSGAWFATAGIDFFRYFQEESLAIICTYVLQVFVGAALVAVAYFFASELYHDRLNAFATIVYAGWYLAFLISLIWYRVEPQPDNFFVGQILSSSITLKLFTLAFIPLWMGAFAMFIRSVRSARIPTDSMPRFYILASIAFILIGAAGAVDEIGIVSGWMVTAARLGTLTASIIAFAASGVLREPDEMVI